MSDDLLEETPEEHSDRRRKILGAIAGSSIAGVGGYTIVSSVTVPYTCDHGNYENGQQVELSSRSGFLREHEEKIRFPGEAQEGQDFWGNSYDVVQDYTDLTGISVREDKAHLEWKRFEDRKVVEEEVIRAEIGTWYDVPTIPTSFKVKDTVPRSAEGYTGDIKLEFEEPTTWISDPYCSAPPSSNAEQ